MCSLLNLDYGVVEFDEIIVCSNKEVYQCSTTYSFPSLCWDKINQWNFLRIVWYFHDKFLWNSFPTYKVYIAIAQHRLLHTIVWEEWFYCSPCLTETFN